MAIPPAFFIHCYYDSPRAVLQITELIDGLPTLVTPIVATMVQAEGGTWLFDELADFRALVPGDLLEINDEFVIHTQPDIVGDDLDESDDDDEDGSGTFKELLNLL